jgi:hypothetical protein
VRQIGACKAAACNKGLNVTAANLARFVHGHLSSRTTGARPASREAGRRP